MSLPNLYYRRTAGTAKACYVCHKPTTTVLATINMVDFLYACPGHLTDPEFATVVADDSTPSVSAEEIARVKAEWEEKKKKKLEKEKDEKEKEKDKEKDSEKDKSKDTERKSDSKGTGGGLKSPTSISPFPPSSTPKHERYILHRHFFTMRQNKHRKQRQAAQAKELAPRLPGAPRGTI